MTTILAMIFSVSAHAGVHHIHEARHHMTKREAGAPYTALLNLRAGGAVGDSIGNYVFEDSAALARFSAIQQQIGKDAVYYTLGDFIPLK